MCKSGRPKNPASHTEPCGSCCELPVRQGSRQASALRLHSPPLSILFAAFPLLRENIGGKVADGAGTGEDKREKLWALMSSYLASGACDALPRACRSCAGSVWAQAPPAPSRGPAPSRPLQRFARGAVWTVAGAPPALPARELTMTRAPRCRQALHPALDRQPRGVHARELAVQL